MCVLEWSPFLAVPGSWSLGLALVPRAGRWPWPGLGVEDWVLFLAPGPWSCLRVLGVCPGAVSVILFRVLVAAPVALGWSWSCGLVLGPWVGPWFRGLGSGPGTPGALVPGRLTWLVEPAPSLPSPALTPVCLTPLVITGFIHLFPFLVAWLLLPPLPSLLSFLSPFSSL